MKHMLPIIILLITCCSEVKNNNPVVPDVFETEEVVEVVVKDMFVPASKKQEAVDTEQPLEKDIHIYFIKVHKPDIQIPETKYKDVMGFTMPKDIFVPDIVPR